ncbi:MAG TPA: aromatic amino acid transport family protein [Candidatus Pacearchaeota archaeon]|nr:aromatic amino acid transport family protein [Candidatus Pacearchaeota archaeon]
MINKNTKKLLVAAFTLTGTIIGAGILGLPYVFSQAGFLSGLFWLFFLTAVILYVGLSIGEISLRTREKKMLSGYAEKYLGKTAKKITAFAVIFGIYSALLAYLIAEGQSLSNLFFGNANYSFYFGFVFWIILTALIYGGLNKLKHVASFGVSGVIALILFLFFFLSPKINWQNIQFSGIQGINFLFPFGVILFALLGFISIPELEIELKNEKKLLKKAIIIGTIIPVVLYLFFVLTFVGVSGRSVNEIATLSLNGFIGKILILLGVFTMTTSYFVLSFVLKDTLSFDLNIKKGIFVLVSLVPLAVYTLINFFDLAGFVSVISLGGSISGGITAIMVLIINKIAKKQGNEKPAYSIFSNWVIITLLGLIFIFGVVFEIIHFS